MGESVKYMVLKQLHSSVPCTNASLGISFGVFSCGRLAISVRRMSAWSRWRCGSQFVSFHLGAEKPLSTKKKVVIKKFNKTLEM